MKIVNGGILGCHYDSFIRAENKERGIWANSPSHAMKRGAVNL
jgi:hypothetical protein